MMKSVHLVLLGAVTFLMACGQTNPESSPAQVPTEPIQASPDQTGSDQTGPDQTDSRLSAQGVNWNTVTVASNGDREGEVSMVLDASSRPVISYRSTSGDLMLVHCGNTTCSSGNIIQKVDGNYSGLYNTLVLDAGGRPVISYRSEDNASYGTLKLVHCGNANCSGGNIYKNLESSYPGPRHSSLVLDAAGKPVLSFEDFGVRFMLFHCNDVNCATRETKNFGDLFIGDTSLALDGRGNPVIGYAVDLNSANPNHSLELVHCGNANCSSGNITRTVDNGAIVARSPSLVLDSVGRPVISYYDAINKNLKFVRCGDANCTNGNSIKILEFAGDVGNSPSMKLNGYGIPVIAHGDATNGTLKLLQCGDPDCSSNISNVVGFVGSGFATTPSLALDVSGKPVIAYGNSSGQIRLSRLIENGIKLPTITPALSGTLGNNGWYISNVNLSWTVVNNGSAITGSSGCGTVTFSTDVLTTIACTATNGGGTSRQAVTIKRDATKPILRPTVNPNPILKYLNVTVTPNASDNLSGVLSRDCAKATTDRVGNFSVVCANVDSAGNKGTATASYTVISASQGIQNLINQVGWSPLISQHVKNQLLNSLTSVQANLAVSKPQTLGLLNQFIYLANSQPPLPYGIDRGFAAVLTASARALIASISIGL